MTGAPGTLGDVLYAGASQQRLVSEKNWVRLVDSVARGDKAALHALYERTVRPVFTLIMRLVSNRATAEELTLDVYQDAWRRAASYTPAEGTVLGWMMNQARAKAIARLRFDQPKVEGLLPIDSPDYRHLLEFKELSRSLRVALSLLSTNERAAIEAAYFGGRPLSMRIRPALHKLLVSPPAANSCDQAESACRYVLNALAPDEASALEDHLENCRPCRREIEALRAVIDSFVAWPTDVLRPSASLQRRLAQRIAGETGATEIPPGRLSWAEPEWEKVAPGIECKLLATDTESHMVSMLVRLEPGGEYPPHTHAGLEELHLLDGELWIDELKLHPGDYNRAERGTRDRRVWSETGCTCVLVTSTKDVLS